MKGISDKKTTENIVKSNDIRCRKRSLDQKRFVKKTLAISQFKEPFSILLF